MTVKQLTFDITLSPERTPELQIPLNRSVELADKPRLSRQAKAIYELLQRGPARTSQLAALSFQYNARLNELRHALGKIGFMVDQKEGEGGQNQYEIVPLEVSSFWRKVKEKGQDWKWS